MNMAAEPTPAGIELNTNPTGIKRLNKVPLVGGIAIACVIVSLLGYAMYQRSIPIELEAGENAQNLSGDTTTPGKLTGPYTGTEIEAYKPHAPTTIPAATAAAPKAAPPVAKEVDLLQQATDRQRQKRLQMAYGALDAPSEVSFKEVTGSGETTAGNAPLDPRAEILKAVMQKNGLGNQSAGNLDASFRQGAEKTRPLLGRDFAMSELLIRSGSIIPATLISGLNSDLPGEVIAQVSQNVYDTRTGQILMIPQGARLVGTYDNKVNYGQSRALVVWNRLVFPDDSALELDRMNGNDMSGYAGFEDEVTFPPS
ncbi:TrbI/VirB10 family protein [Candidatus Vondammii sp. HM_W22]|uniref:TrbI/VirB10 family protein n=1 Tax=Candidatus Vondammii sp. HM_W22 TaxID=2687299 RepID=UPI001F14512C|nr:TrbI/VirB10 family protein [Candidatus Vondammii sp. HM_W22]